MDKSKAVKELFENPAVYLTYDYNLRIRKETVEVFTEEMNCYSVLDVPCGTGEITLPLLEKAEELTLLDISANMLAIAKKNIPAGQQDKVKIINDDFFKTDLQRYDLVVCLGLLAHVNFPLELLERLSSLVKPGGYLIIQNTDSSHFYSYLIRVYLGFKNLVAKQPYKLNRVSASFLEKDLKKRGFEKMKCYRYNQSFLGFSNLFSNERKYKITRRFFGDARNNKNASFGSDYIYLFKKTA